MTNEEWKIVEHELSSLFGSVKMKIDGYDVCVQVARVSAMKFCLAIYIDGKFKGKWVTEDCEIRRRFCQQHKNSLLTREDRNRLKRERKVVREAVEKKATYYWYEPYWGSFRSMKNHLVKNNKSIELI